MPARRGTWPLAAREQQADQVRRIGVLLSYIEPDPQAQHWERMATICP
jgi:hypothetical protein